MELTQEEKNRLHWIKHPECKGLEKCGYQSVVEHQVIKDNFERLLLEKMDSLIKAVEEMHKQ